MKIDYLRKGKVTFSMESYIKQILEEAPYNMEGIAKTPAACHLFNVNDGARSYKKKKCSCFTTWWQSSFTCAAEHDKTYKQLWLFFVPE